MSRWESIEGSPYPLGVSWVSDERAYNFAIYSKHAEGITLHLYTEANTDQPAFSISLDYLKNKSGPIWHCRVPVSAADGAKYYAFQASGPSPGPGFSWHNFDAEKILLDPYAKTVHFPPDFDRRAAEEPGSNAGRAPLGVLCAPVSHFDWSGDESVRHESDLIIYEMHVRGFTMNPSSGVSETKRGTFLGVIEKIPYLCELGVTAVELMPIYQFDPHEGNYWGYMPLNLFSPHHAYSTDPAACRQLDEFREMVKALHIAGIEVILDVVYNHTCEGDHSGPMYSFKGLDNTTYYMISQDPDDPYSNFSGTGNTLHTANRAVRRLIIESLRYWVKEMHVDGFRFDLASIFTRNSDGSVNTTDPPIFAQIASDEDLASVRLIAEPWDTDTFQLGLKFPGTRWMQWNSRYRDTVQRAVRGDPGMVPDLMTRLYGSADLFPDDRPHAYHPSQSVNYVTSHDGFTLYDLVSYDCKNNWANGHDNKDGHDDFSWNCDWEGDEQVPAEVMRLRKQQVKNFCCLMMLSNGTPMFRMGDEFLQTQRGNSNPYNQDNDISWLDWERLEAHQDVFRFFKMMIRFRRRHASICRSRFWRDDIQWYGPQRWVDLSYDSRAFAFSLRGNSQQDNALYVMINGHPHDIDFGIHEGELGQWRRFIDTSQESPTEFFEETDAPTISDHFYTVRGRSVVVFVG